MEILEKLQWRYATKKFNPDKKLSDTQLNVLIHAFNLTATSYGLQTMKLVVVAKQELKDSLLSTAYFQKQVVQASHVLVLCIQNDISETDVDNYFDAVSTTRETPETILSPYRNQLKSTIGSMQHSTKREWAIRQTYIALGNLMTVCAIENIDSCPMEGFVPEKVDEALNLKAHNLTSVLLLPVGFRADDDMFSTFKKVRKPIEEVVISL
ncbi:NAD(P)H-dependent oxidoreductase [Paucihalobacter sp.]|uniref:NAD(P)H-dependent oxidoreductase n=1 Tax=Paucihalobacter sp. TaxID=2850405 RepID=UPI002FE32548